MLSKGLNVILRIRGSHGAFKPRIDMLCFIFLKNHSGSHKENGSLQETNDVCVMYCCVTNNTQKLEPANNHISLLSILWVRKSGKDSSGVPSLIHKASTWTIYFQDGSPLHMWFP